MEMAVTMPLRAILEEYPVCRDFFLNLRIADLDWELTLLQALETANPDVFNEFGLDKGMILRDFCRFLETFAGGTEGVGEIRSLTIIGGHGKTGESEIPELTVSVGDIISIVGPTGSGKSRLLADIECLADGDTPTGRKILVDGRTLTDDERFDRAGRMVAQLSQNMNFVMDLTVREFLEMHAVSRQSSDVEKTVSQCFECATHLAGERFTRDTKVTQLSGGQSRALMIADTAYMSCSPIVLIDEIENAGIDRRRAVELLAKKEKIVFLATHDPLLALSAQKRIVIKNGGISRVIETSGDERECLGTIEKLDAILYRLRHSLRDGQVIGKHIMEGIE